MKYSSDISAASDDEIVCWCAGVSKGEILSRIAAGAGTLADIQQSTGACMQGDCKKKNPRGR